MEKDNRDPATLGLTILASLAKEREKNASTSVGEVADRIDRGVAGTALCHPAMFNGKSHLRLSPETVEGVL